MVPCEGAAHRVQTHQTGVAVDLIAVNAAPRRGSPLTLLTWLHELLIVVIGDALLVQILLHEIRLLAVAQYILQIFLFLVVHTQGFGVFVVLEHKTRVTVVPPRVLVDGFSNMAVWCCVQNAGQTGLRRDLKLTIRTIRYLHRLVSRPSALAMKRFIAHFTKGVLTVRAVDHRWSVAIKTRNCIFQSFFRQSDGVCLQTAQNGRFRGGADLTDRIVPIRLSEVWVVAGDSFLCQARQTIAVEKHAH
mmetsp:Transcript_27188/g.45864  ORF Transcript_27188/g.45864 Transcript_27188/m.45864 type:complete len:246 (-) Transcript_27188:255-992(-)